MKRIGLIFKTILSRQWLLPTIVVMAGMALLAQLGFWQLDRLEQRRVVNIELTNSLARESLVLPDAQLPEDIELLKNRDVSVRGTFDFEYEGQLILQNWQSQPGIRLLTPLLIEGTETAVLVDRGWIPEAAIETQSQFQQQGTVTVDGYIALTQLPRTGGENAKSVRGEGEWYRVNVEAYETAVPYDLYPFYIVQEPDPNTELELPYKQELEVDLSEGSHLGYAIQWFMFSGMLGFAYISYVSIELRKKATT